MGMNRRVPRILFASFAAFHSSRDWPLSMEPPIHGIRLPASGTPKCSVGSPPFVMRPVTRRSSSSAVWPGD